MNLVVLLLKLTLVVHQLVLKLIYLLLQDLNVVSQTVISLIMLLQLLSGTGDLLDLELQFRINLLCLRHLLSVLLLIQLHSFAHLAQFLVIGIQLLLQTLILLIYFAQSLLRLI